MRRSLHRERCKLIILAIDAGESLLKMGLDKVPVLRLVNRSELGEWFGRKEVSILGITDPHLAETLRKKAEGSDPGPIFGR